MVVTKQLSKVYPTTHSNQLLQPPPQYTASHYHWQVTLS